MEKAILKTLIYADIFDYPLKAYEIHKWLILKEASFQKVQKGLSRLLSKNKIRKYKDYFFLAKNNSLVLKRIKKIKSSKDLILKAKVLSYVLKLIPWIKLIGVSGGLAMGNSLKRDDIDLFIITSKNRLWLSRLLSVLFLSLLTVRRTRKAKKIGGKFCLNIFLEEDELEQEKKDLYTAHEVLQMKVIWERDGVYSKFLADNEWVFKYLPNWTTNLSSPRKRGSNSEPELFNWIPAFAGMTVENLAKWVQLKYMGQPKGMERITEGALYFHPFDYRQKILGLYKQKLAVLDKVC